MNLSVLLIALFAFNGCAHMGISINEIGPRDKDKLGDSYRFPNNGVCSSTSPGDVQTKVNVGELITGKTSYGAGHGGGHCAWFISKDQKNWYKINDKIDCTPSTQPTQPNAGTHDLVIPANVPIECATKCVLGWFWSPRFSGGCEIYHDCFDIQVQGATGIDGNSGVTITTPLTCSRVNGAGITPMFGQMTGGSTPTPAGGTTTTSKCNTYTVMSGDNLSQIATTHKTTIDEILAINPQIDNPDQISLNQLITLPPCSGGSNNCETYTVKSGDYISKIATEKGTTTEAILSVNPQVTDVTALQIGDVLNIPPCSDSAPPNASPPSGTQDCTCSDQKLWCQVNGCSFNVQINQCWGSPPFFYCECKDGTKPKPDPICSNICSGTSCRAATEICTLPSSCTPGADPPIQSCNDGIKNGEETGIDCGGPCSACQTYQWSLQPWSDCTKNCGAGTQSRRVTCVDAAGTSVAESNCPAPIPDQSQTCNSNPCSKYSWKSAEYGPCNVNCGQGKQFRSIECISTTYSSSVVLSLCDINDIPATERVCTGDQEQCGNFEWKFGEWQYCSSVSGQTCADGVADAKGTQFREVFCYPYPSTEPVNAVANAQCKNTKPIESQECTVSCPKSYNWNEGSWTQCSQPCVGKGSAGFQERNVVCMSGNIAVDDSLCDITMKPPTFREGCSTTPCDANYWVTAPWGPCNDQSRTRLGGEDGVKCMLLNGSIGTDNDCTQPKPPISEACSIGTKNGGDIDNGSLTLPCVTLATVLPIFMTIAAQA